MHLCNYTGKLMNFKTFFELNAVLNAPVDNINLIKKYNSYEYIFDVNEYEYSVDFIKRIYIVDQHGDIELDALVDEEGILDLTVWAIVLNGPGGTDLTYLNEGMFTIYKNLLLAIKKLMQIENVEAFEIKAARKPMEIIYYKFYEKYLKNEFVYYKENLLIRKDVLEKIKQHINPSHHNSYQQNILKANQQKLNYVNKIRQSKLDGRTFSPNQKNIISVPNPPPPGKF